MSEPTSASRSVSSIRLDTFLATTLESSPYLLKIDVEGAEIPAAILRGATNTLTLASAVVIEMTVDRFMQRASILESAGFDIWDIADLCYYDGCLWQVDAIFINRHLKAKIPSLRPMSQKPFRSELWQSK